MTTAQRNDFTSPVGRFVWGSLYEPQTKDFDGNPMTVKSGPDAGKPTQRYEFGVAVPKTQAHFANEPGWGQLAWATAHAAFPGGDRSAAMAPDFSWKIVDGDSTVVSTKSKSKTRPCDREGFKGCWVIKFSSSFAPKVYDAIANAENPPLLEAKGAVLPGDYIQVLGSMAGNTGKSPGIYINHNAVGLKGYGTKIVSAGIDVAGKFGGAVPAGASATPVGGFAPPAAPAAPAPSTGQLPPPAAAPAPVAVAPGLAAAGLPPLAAASPPPAAAPAAPPAPVGRPPHKGVAYDEYIKAGWTLEQLRSDGYLG
jgi:hypothetical protein